METIFSSRQWEFSDSEEAHEFFHRQGWTDGLPIILPTPEKVTKMLESARLNGNEIIGTIPERNRVITAEKLAINAVMAGCIPGYMPVILAAAEAVLDPAFGVHGPSASTGGAAIMLIVNGPIIHQIGMNSGKGMMSSTHRPNATIGRAIQLLLRNAGGTLELDQTTIGHPGKLSFCIAEAEYEGWTPLHIERGYQQTESTVTVFAAEGPNQINNHFADTPEGILLTVADRMSALGTFHMQRQTQCAVVLCPEHLQTLLENNWDKRRTKQFLFEHAGRPQNDFYRFGLEKEPFLGQEWKTAVPSPDDIILLSGGGPAGRFSALIPGWGSIHQTKAVTKKISTTGFT